MGKPLREAAKKLRDSVQRVNLSSGEGRQAGTAFRSVVEQARQCAKQIGTLSGRVRQSGRKVWRGKSSSPVQNGARSPKRYTAGAVFRGVAARVRIGAPGNGEPHKSSRAAREVIWRVSEASPEGVKRHSKRDAAGAAFRQIAQRVRGGAQGHGVRYRKGHPVRSGSFEIDESLPEDAATDGVQRGKARSGRTIVWHVKKQPGEKAGGILRGIQGLGGLGRMLEKRSGKRLAFGALAAVSALVFCVSGIKLFGYALDYLNMRRVSASLREAYYAQAAEETPEPAMVASVQLSPDAAEAGLVQQTHTPALTEQAAPTPAPTPQTMLATVRYPDNPFAEISSRFAKIRRQNSDIVGWLTLEDLIDEAVVQRDNEYYLNRDYRGYHNVNGAIFLEQTCDLSTRPYTLVLYGHNMKTGAMFGGLRNYEDFHYYKSNAFITFDTAYEEGRYVIFSVCTVSTRPADRHYLDFARLCSNQIDWRQEEIDALEQYSLYHTSLSVQPDDQLLLLVTCVDADTDRRVVAARRIRRDETEGMLQRSINNAAKK